MNGVTLNGSGLPKNKVTSYVGWTTVEAAVITIHIWHLKLISTAYEIVYLKFK